MMIDSRADCPTCYNPLHVTVKYDYNMQRANMFSYHVGAVTCYLLDAQGRVVDWMTSENTLGDQPQKDTAYEFNFEGLDEGNYRLMAVAAQRPMQDGSSPLNPAVTPLTLGEDVRHLRVATTPEDDALVGGFCSAVPLDTVWYALNDHTVHVEPFTTSYDTLSLMRLTNNLNIMLVQSEHPLDNAADQYEVRILDHNTLLDYDAAQMESPLVTYTPYAAWTTETLDEETSEPVARTAHYDLSFSRLFAHSDAADNARLQIVNRRDQHTIVDIDLIHYLALARSASELRYPVQEFLDREYDFRLHFLLAGNQWQYMTISIGVLSWTLRVQNESLHS